VAAQLGRYLALLGREDEAERLALRGREAGVEEDVVTQILWRQALALVRSHRGEHQEAVRLAREAAEVASGSDNLNAQGQALADFGHVLVTAGRPDEPLGAFEQALECFERRRNVVMAGRVRDRLASLRQLHE